MEYWLEQIALYNEQLVINSQDTLGYLYTVQRIQLYTLVLMAGMMVYMIVRKK